MKKLIVILMVMLMITVAGISVYAYSNSFPDTTPIINTDITEKVEIKEIPAFASRKVVNILPTTFSSQKDEIIYKMLNSVDYFSTAKVSFSALFPGFNVEQNYFIETNLDTGVAHQICSDNFVQTESNEAAEAYETYADGNVVKEYNNLERTVYTIGAVQERRTLSEEWPNTEERYYLDDNGEPHYRYRGNPTNADMAGECLVPQVSAFAYLMDKNLWDVVDSIKYCNRNCFYIEGTVRESYSSQIGADTFMMYVDEKTGILLKLEAYNENGNVVSSMIVSEITIDLPIICSTFNYDMSKYREYVAQE